MFVRRHSPQLRLSERWLAYRHRLWTYTQLGLIVRLCMVYTHPGEVGMDTGLAPDISTWSACMTMRPFWTKKTGMAPSLAARLVVSWGRLLVLVTFVVSTSL
jgi:hypothetical protein